MITKVSEIKVADVANYIRLDTPTADENKYLETIINVAKSYIKSNTGCEDLDTHPDFVIVIYILCQDMYDNRSYYVDNNNVNKVVQTILDMHTVNLLWVKL